MRSLKPPPLPIGPYGLIVYSGAPGEIRTPTTRNLNPVPLPVGLQGQTLALSKGIEPSSTLRQRVSLTRCLREQISVLVTAIQRCLFAQQVLRQDGSRYRDTSGGRNLYPPKRLISWGGDLQALISANYGAPTTIRTPDLLITNQLLYQLSYKGIFLVQFISENFLKAFITNHIQYLRVLRE